MKECGFMFTSKEEKRVKQILCKTLPSLFECGGEGMSKTKLLQIHGCIECKYVLTSDCWHPEIAKDKGKAVDDPYGFPEWCPLQEWPE